MSGLTPTSDIDRRTCDFRFVPEAAVDGRLANLGDRTKTHRHPRATSCLNTVSISVWPLSEPCSPFSNSCLLQECGREVTDVSRRDHWHGLVERLQKARDDAQVTCRSDVASHIVSNWTGRRIVELEGPRRITPNQIAATFAKILGRPVRMEAVPRDTWERLFASQGTKNPVPRAQMLDGFNEGWIVRATNSRRLMALNVRFGPQADIVKNLLPDEKGPLFFCCAKCPYWPIASIRTHTLNGRYRRHSGHCSALARNGSVANEPKRTCTEQNEWGQQKGASPSC
jgi:hypothetical protein